MWYLNFCAPFIYDQSGSPQTIRYILFITLLIQFIIYIFYIAKYKLFGQTIDIRAQIDEGNQNQQGMHIKKQGISYPGFGERQHRMDQKNFKQWYLHYFGLHSVAVAGCIMYSPYAITLVFAFLHLATFAIGTIMHSCMMSQTLTRVYSVVMLIAVIMDIILLFSISMGVGASGYDSSTKNCYLLQ